MVGFARPAAAGEYELDQARAHANKATAAFDLGYYGEAAREYEAAYAGTLDANLLFNLGRAWRLAGDRQKALTAFRSYLRAMPYGERAVIAQANIRELEEQPMVVPLAVPPPITQPPMAEGPPLGARITTSNGPVIGDPEPYYASAAFWVGIALIITAGVVVGVVLENRGGELSMPNTTYGSQKF